MSFFGIWCNILAFKVKTIKIFGKLYYTNIIIINNNIETFINILLKLVICNEYF